MIEVRGLTKRFGRTTAVNDLSFDVRPGRVTGFLGPNGSGKSTSMRCMLALDRPDAGSALFDGRPYDTIRDPLFKVGALLDAGYVHPGRNGRNHLRMIAASNGIGDTRVDEVLELVGLADVAKRRVGTYSLGMRQRLGLASVLLGDPDVVILDEPANGLDPEGIRWIRDVLVHLAGQGKTVLVSSHLLSEMAQMADDLVVIGLGRLIDTGTVADFVTRNARHWVRVRSPQIAQLADQLRSGGATVTMLDDGGAPLTPGIDVIGPTATEIGELAARNSAILHELSPQQGSLEDAFLEATAGAQEYRSTSPVANASGAAAAPPTGPVYATPPPQQPPFAPPATNPTNGGQP